MARIRSTGTPCSAAARAAAASQVSGAAWAAFMVEIATVSADQSWTSLRLCEGFCPTDAFCTLMALILFCQQR
jgi:hypothetical protein